jgi:hypothetical protein
VKQDPQIAAVLVSKTKTQIGPPSSLRKISVPSFQSNRKQQRKLKIMPQEQTNDTSLNRKVLTIEKAPKISLPEFKLRENHLAQLSTI